MQFRDPENKQIFSVFLQKMDQLRRIFKKFKISADFFDLVIYHTCETTVGTFLYRWRPKKIPSGEHQLIIKNAVEDSYKRLILPFFTRSYRYV